MTFRSIQFWTTIVVMVLAPFFFGSVDLFWIVIWTVLLSLGALCGLNLPTSAGQSRILLGFLILCGVYALVAIIQIIPNAIPQLNDPIWGQAGRLIDRDLAPRISSRAEIPAPAIGSFLLFAFSFVNGFCVGTSRHGSDRLVWFARYSILLYAIYGLAALVFTPNMILWAPKFAYRGSVTSTFVNHNTAATFIGAGSIIWFCFAFYSLQALRLSSIRLLLTVQSNERLAFKIITRSLAALTCFFALLLTSSRGGLICSCLGLLAAIILMIVNRRKPRLWLVIISAIVSLAAIFLLLGQMGRIGSEGLFDDARWRVYELCIEAIRQRPLLGAGLGTFSELFPSLRDTNFYSWGVWESAHSTILEIAVEMGVPIALMVTAAALASLFILAHATVRSEGRSRRLFAAITGIVVLTYLHSMIDFSLQIPGYLIVFGILLGCGLARASAAQAPVGSAQSRSAA